MPSKRSIDRRGGGGGGVKREASYMKLWLAGNLGNHSLLLRSKICAFTFTFCVSALDEMAPQDKEDALSIFTSLSYTPPLHRKPKLAAIPSKPKSSLSIASTDLSLGSRSSSATSNDTSRRLHRKNVLRPLIVTDSGFASDGTRSSRESIRPVETPFTPVTRRISRLSLRSIIVSDDSGCSTYYRESDSCESRSPSVLSSSSGNTMLKSHYRSTWE